MEFIGRDRFVLEEVFRDGNQLLAVIRENLTALGRSLVDDGFYFFIDDAGGFFGIALGCAEVTPDKNAVIGRIKKDGAEALTHTVTHDHIFCDGSCLLDVSRGAG